jgi:hypothetical protein
LYRILKLVSPEAKYGIFWQTGGLHHEAAG